MTELAEIFHRHGPQYRAKFGDRMLSSHRRAMRAIERCRTAALGGHAYYCEECEETEYRYHSCRNRHCPKCQNGKAQQWLERQQDLLLPVAYFLLTFTLPSELRGVARSHQKRVYHLLFRTSAAAAQHPPSLGRRTKGLAGDPRFVGGQMGLVGVLHILWGTIVYPSSLIRMGSYQALCLKSQIRVQCILPGLTQLWIMWRLGVIWILDTLGSVDVK
jgi:hypothetical protein